MLLGYGAVRRRNHRLMDSGWRPSRKDYLAMALMFITVLAMIAGHAVANL